jgi:4-amino-4-deoxy-L-arabinose transferase-like glycosyltransferase
LPKIGQPYPDALDSQWYMEYARSMLEHFQIGKDMNDILYIGYNMTLTLLVAIFKQPERILFVQGIIAGLSIFFLFQIARMLFNRTTAVIACYYYAYSWDITFWSVYLLSDSLFISLLLMCVYFLLKSRQSPKRRYKVLFILSLIYLLVFRPMGIITAFFIVVYVLICIPKARMLHFLRKYVWGIVGVLALGIGAFLYLLFGHSLDPLIASMQFNAKKVLYNIYANGWIYDKPNAYDHPFRPNYEINILNSLILSFIINNWDHIVVIYVKRAIAFIGFWVWMTDLHTLAGIKMFFVKLLPTLFFFLGTLFAIWNRVFRQSSIVWLNIFTVFIFCVIFFIDGFYRYKAPSIPFIYITIAYGIDCLVRPIVRNSINYTEKRLWTKSERSQ